MVNTCSIVTVVYKDIVLLKIKKLDTDMYID